MNWKLKMVVLVCTLLLAAGCAKEGGQEQQDNKDRQEKKEYYVDASPAGMEFAVCGKDGRLAMIDMDGKVRTIETDIKEDLNAVAGNDETLVAVSDQGNIYIWEKNQSIKAMHEAEGNSLYDIVNFKDQWIMAGENGIWLGASGRGGRQVLKSEEKYISAACSADLCICVREDGVLSLSYDGETWEEFNFNEYYGYDFKLQQLIYGGGNFYLLAEEDGNQKIYVSQLGSVWSERMLDMLEGKPADLSEEVFVGMVWDGQEVVVGCASGKLLTLPDCTECNKLEETELKELSDLTYCGGFYLLVKPDGETQVLAQDEANVRQYKISIESAREKTEAQFVDVRSKEEYDKGHIEGSIHLDVDKIEELPEYIPNKEKEIIFCCTKGIRSKTALEKALEMGYANVFYMGNVEEW